MLSNTSITQELGRLRREFPLQARIEAAQIAARAAYRIVLQAWLDNGAAPQPHIIPLHCLNQLVELDALVVTESGLGCYPFSAVETGISVEYGSHRVNAILPPAKWIPCQTRSWTKCWRNSPRPSSEQWHNGMTIRKVCPMLDIDDAD
ncbi:hypothetical protein [Sulfuriferula multivorans]|uniref:hypothetical protein n=1 Tax=Sulfuriferula multivorans TaxID=1559896 RepID=UPI000F5C25DD|nr:hypothetical protein [Sulfuriferula multivorans]